MANVVLRHFSAFRRNAFPAACRSRLAELQRQQRLSKNISIHQLHNHAHPPYHITSISHRSRGTSIMALDSFFHNKIESMKLEIIQGQAVLRRLEAQRNDYNSRGNGKRKKSPGAELTVYSASITRGTWVITAARIVCWRGSEGDGNQEGPGQGTPRRQIW